MTRLPIPKKLSRLAARLAPKARAAGSRWRKIRSIAAMYWPGRRTVLLTLGMTYLFLAAGEQAAFAADNERGGILAPLNVMSSEGAPLDNYDLKSDPGGTTDIRSHVCNLLIGGGFALVRLAVGLMCWIVGWIWNFPIVSTLIDTAHVINYKLYVVTANDLNLYDLFLAGGVAFGALLIMRGKVGRGAGEMAITLLLSATVMLPMFTPRAILGEQGPLVQAQQAAHEAGQIVTNVNGPDPGCTSDKDKDDPSCPMRMMLTRTLVVQPFELLQYGQIPAKDSWLADVHNRYIHGQLNRKGNCDDVIDLPGKDAICDHGSAGYAALKDELKDKHGQEGKDVYNYAVNSDWDKVGGVALILLAVLIVAIVVLGMALVHIGTQFADVVAASLSAPAGVWAMLPGGNRAALWKWIGVFLTSVVTELAVSMMLPLFTLGANGILTNSANTVMIQRLLILDGFAVVVLVFHRRIFAAAGQLGDRFANRMRFAKIGGTLFMGENTGLGLAMSQAMGNLSPGAGGYSGGRSGGIAGLGLFGGGGGGVSSALMRKARIGEGLAALADPGLGRMSAGVMAAGAAGEVRRGMAALALPVRAAHQLVVGNPLPPHKLARRMKPVGTKGPLGGELPYTSGPHAGQHGPGGQGGPGRGGTTAGRHVMMPKDGTTPIGHALHNRLLNTRAGRMAILAGKAGKFGWDVTAGAPATATRLHRKGGVLLNHAGQQWRHYSAVGKAWWKDEKQGFRAVANGTKETYNTVKGAARHQYMQAAVMGQTYGPKLINGVRSAYDNTRLAYDATIGSVADTSGPLPSRAGTAAHGEVWEHARDRGPEYPFYETEPSVSALGGDSLRDDGRVIVRPDDVDNGPADLWSALGPGVVPTPQPLAVVEDEPGMLVDRSTGEIRPATPVDRLRTFDEELLADPNVTSYGPSPTESGWHWTKPGSTPEPGEPARIDRTSGEIRPTPSAAEPDPAMDPSVLRRVSPQFRDPGRDLLEAMRMRRHLDGRAGGGSVPDDGFDGEPEL
ncbi:hypothetical protein ACGF12_22675 [Kitasatospora sp. NPDC048296]|uniref:hypothetical protein n=1 Tax=Kitasatospora sp. NPDC048296 TaxID=3364048 RepID=UPI0037226F12